MTKQAGRNIKALWLVIIAALTLEGTALVQLHFSQKGIRNEASMRAKVQLTATQNRIMDIVNQTEAAVRNNIWIAQWCMEYPDSMVRVCQRLVADNPVVAGTGRFSPLMCSGTRPTAFGYFPWPLRNMIIPIRSGLPNPLNWATAIGRNLM